MVFILGIGNGITGGAPTNEGEVMKLYSCTFSRKITIDGFSFRENNGKIHAFMDTLGGVEVGPGMELLVLVRKYKGKPPLPPNEDTPIKGNVTTFRLKK